MDIRFRYSLSVAALLLATQSAPARSQAAPQLQAQSLTESGNASACVLSTSMQAGARWDNAALRLLTGPITHSGTRHALRPALALDLSTPTVRAWRVRAATTLGAAEQQCASQSQWSRGWVQLERDFGPNTISLSAGARSLSDADPTQDRQGVAVGFSRLSHERAWGIDVRAHTISNSALRRFSRTVTWPDSVRNDTTGGWNRFNRTRQEQDSGLVMNQSNALSLRAHWKQRLGPVALSVTAGGSGDVQSLLSSNFSIDSANNTSALQRALRVQLWASAGASAPITRDIGVSLSVAALPTLSNTVARPSRVIALGFSAATGRRVPDSARSLPEDATTFEMIRMPAADSLVRDARDSMTIRVRLRAEHARRVEVSGEPLAWQPVALRRTRNGWWEADVRMVAGTHRMSVRIDGSRWTAPPGYPAMRDEFGGEVALVTVR